MKCKNCKRVIDDDSIFCKWCGERQIRERKKKDEIKVPSPRQLKSGKWNIELRAEGQSITEDTAALCEAKARAIRAGFLEAKKDAKCSLTLLQAIDSYLEKNQSLSPSTIRGYECIKKIASPERSIPKYRIYQIGSRRSTSPAKPCPLKQCIIHGVLFAP